MFIEGRDGLPDGDAPEADTPGGHSWVCSYPPCSEVRANAEPGDCRECGEPLVEIDAAGYEVTT